MGIFPFIQYTFSTVYCMPSVTRKNQHVARSPLHVTSGVGARKCRRLLPAADCCRQQTPTAYAVQQSNDVASMAETVLCWRACVATRPCFTFCRAVSVNAHGMTLLVIGHIVSRQPASWSLAPINRASHCGRLLWSDAASVCHMHVDVPRSPQSCMFWLNGCRATKALVVGRWVKLCSHSRL